MVRYCPSCGRSVPLDAKICPYCAKSIASHEGLIIPEPEQKKDKTVLIIVAVVILLLVVPIAIAATVYVYVSGMLPESPNISPTPSISFMKDENMNTLLVISADPYNVKWSDINIQGICDTSGLSTYVQLGNKITDCSGTITIIYEPTNSILGTWTFT